MCWQFGRSRAIRDQDWKLVKHGSNDWELYNLKDDPTELNNLAKARSQRVEQMASAWARWWEGGRPAPLQPLSGNHFPQKLYFTAATRKNCVPISDPLDVDFSICREKELGQLGKTWSELRRWRFVRPMHHRTSIAAPLDATFLKKVRTLGQISTDVTVAVVDDDHGLLRLMETIVQSAGLNFAGWQDGTEFLAAFSPDEVNCLIIDMLLPQVSGQIIFDRLQELPYCPPVIMISGASDVPLAVQAMKRGALDFLRKPFSRMRFLQAIEEALKVDRQQRQRFFEKQQLQSQLASLTSKEREVLDLLVEGMLNKQIARRLDISVRAVELRRASLFRKMQVASVVELMRRLCGPEQFFSSHPPQQIVGRPTGNFSDSRMPAQSLSPSSI